VVKKLYKTDCFPKHRNCSKIDITPAFPSLLRAMTLHQENIFGKKQVKNTHSFFLKLELKLGSQVFLKAYPTGLI